MQETGKVSLLSKLSFVYLEYQREVANKLHIPEHMTKKGEGGLKAYDAILHATYSMYSFFSRSDKFKKFS